MTASLSKTTGVESAQPTFLSFHRQQLLLKHLHEELVHSHWKFLIFSPDEKLSLRWCTKTLCGLAAVLWDYLKSTDCDCLASFEWIEEVSPCRHSWPPQCFPCSIMAKQPWWHHPDCLLSCVDAVIHSFIRDTAQS